MSIFNPTVANYALLPIDATAASPAIAFGNLKSGTGWYGTYGLINIAVSAVDIASIDSTGIVMASGKVLTGNVTGSITGDVVLTGNVKLFTGATAPVDGTTGDNVAAKGSLYVALDSGVLYQNNGVITNPTWIIVETSTSGAGALLTGYVSGAGTVAASDTILQGIQKLNGNAGAISTVANAALPSASFTSAAVTSKLLTGFVSGSGTVAAADSILVGINKLDGNTSAVSTVANAALPSASFTSAAVTAKLLTGLAAGSNTPISATDSILVALANLQAQIDAI